MKSIIKELNREIILLVVLIVLCTVLIFMVVDPVEGVMVCNVETKQLCAYYEETNVMECSGEICG